MSTITQDTDSRVKHMVVSSMCTSTKCLMMMEGSGPHISNTKMFLIKKSKEHRPWACNSMPKECLPYGFFFIKCSYFTLITIFLCFCPRTLLRKEFQVSRAEGRSWLGPHVAGYLWMWYEVCSLTFPWSLNSKPLSWRALHQPPQPTRSF